MDPMAREAPLSQLSKHGSMEKCPVLGAVAREGEQTVGIHLVQLALGELSY